MVRMKAILTLIFLIASLQLSQAQYAWDVGGNAGFSNYLGEIGGGAGQARGWILDLELQKSRINLGGFVRYRLDYDFAVRANVNFIRLEAADSVSENPNRFTRNLSFRNDIIEFTTVAEYYFFNAPDVGRTGRYLLDFKAYISAGFGFFTNNPKGSLGGQWYNLRQLKTEGQESPYSGVQAIIPLSFGFDYTFARVHRFGVNVGYRLTFTDYIDDVSSFYPDPDALESDIARALSNRTSEVADLPLAQSPDAGGGPLHVNYVEGAIRGNPKANDYYLTGTVSYSFVIRGNPSSFGNRKNYLYGRKRGRSGKARF